MRISCRLFMAARIPAQTFAMLLRDKKGEDIWMMGGAGIIASFLDEGEIDEFMLHIVPEFTY